MTTENNMGFSGISNLVSDIEQFNESDIITSQSNVNPSSKESSIKNNQIEKTPVPLNQNNKKEKPKVRLGPGGKVILWIIIITAFFLIIAKRKDKMTDTSQNPFEQTFSNISNSRKELAIIIENDKKSAKLLEEEISDLDNKINREKRNLEYYERAEMFDEYNELVPRYNSFVSKRNSLYEEYRDLIDDINAKVKRYNSLRR